MEIFQHLISEINKEETRYYKLLNKIYEPQYNRLDEKLFDYAKKNIDFYDDNLAFKTIYNSKNKNSFYRLKNRIINDISNSLLIQNIDRDEFVKSIKYIFLNKLFFHKNNTALAKYYLKKAEKNSFQNEFFELLDIIYAEYLKLSLKDLTINPKEYIEKRNEISNKINELRKVDEILALVNYELKTSQNYSQKNKKLIEDIDTLIKSFKIDNKIQISKRYNIKLYELISKKILNDEDYANLEKYVLKTYRYFEKQHLFDKSTHDIKLQMLTYLANSYFKNNKFEKSIASASVLFEEMKKFDELLFEQYYFFYINILVINYSVLDKPKAIQLLESLKNNKIIG